MPHSIMTNKYLLIDKSMFNAEEDSFITKL